MRIISSICTKFSSVFALLKSLCVELCFLAWLLAVELRKHICILLPLFPILLFWLKSVGQQMTVLGRLLTLKILALKMCFSFRLLTPTGYCLMCSKHLVMCHCRRKHRKLLCSSYGKWKQVTAFTHLLQYFWWTWKVIIFLSYHTSIHTTNMSWRTWTRFYLGKGK